MKVTGQKPPIASELTTGKAREAEKQPDRKTQPDVQPLAPARNRTSLTMRKIRDVIDNTPDVRAERVAALKAQVKNGTYEVDAERLADAILTESMREDLEKP